MIFFAIQLSLSLSTCLYFCYDCNNVFILKKKIIINCPLTLFFTITTFCPNLEQIFFSSFYCAHPPHQHTVYAGFNLRLDAKKKKKLKRVMLLKQTQKISDKKKRKQSLAIFKSFFFFFCLGVVFKNNNK